MIALIAAILSRLLDAVKLLIIIRCIISWIPNFYNSFTEVIYKITDPVLRPVQNVMSRLMNGHMMIDFSPIIVFVLIEFVQRLLFRIVF